MLHIQDMGLELVELKQDKKYYNANELLSRHQTINMICGDRFGGKSTCIQKYTIKRAIEFLKHNAKGGQFAVLCRYDKDKKLLCETYFENTMLMFYKDYELKFARQKFYMKKKSTDNWQVVGYAFALNEATKRKSTSYPHITTIILEEFMNLEDKYIKSKQNPELEVELLISLYSTIARGNGQQVRDNVKVFLISNNFYINNPYFKYFNFIEKIINNPFKRFYESKTIPKAIIEMTHNDIKLDIGRDDINKGNKFIDMQNELKLIKKPAVKNILFQISLDNREFLNVANYNDGNIIFTNGDKVRADALTFSCSDIKKEGILSINTLKKQETYKKLLEAFNNNWLYYDKLDTYITLYNILNF